MKCKQTPNNENEKQVMGETEWINVKETSISITLNMYLFNKYRLIISEINENHRPASDQREDSFKMHFECTLHRGSKDLIYTDRSCNLHSKTACLLQ